MTPPSRDIPPDSRPAMDTRVPPPRNMSAVLFDPPHDFKWLTQEEMKRLTAAFRHWKNAAPSPGIQLSRQRIWLIFLLLRHTGAKVGEVLNLRLQCFSPAKGTVIVDERPDSSSGHIREIYLPDDVLREMNDLPTLGHMWGEACFSLNQGYLRRVFHARAQEAGLEKSRAAPGILRNSKAVEMLRNGTPMSVVQKILGLDSPMPGLKQYSTDALETLQRYHAHAACVSQVSARNTFVCAVEDIIRGQVISEVRMRTRHGAGLAACITSSPLENQRFSPGALVTATVKPVLVNIAAAGTLPVTSARNTFAGTVSDIRTQATVSEVAVRLPCGDILCALISSQSLKDLNLRIGDEVVAFFKALSVVVQFDFKDPDTNPSV